MGHIKEKKVNQTCLLARKVKPTDGYFTWLLDIISPRPGEVSIIERWLS